MMFAIFRSFCSVSPLLSGINRSILRIIMPLEGFGCTISPAHRAAIGDRITSFTAARAVRRAADLARPV